MNYIENLLQGQKVEWRTLGELGEFYGGLTGKNKNDFSEGNAKYVTYVNVFKNPALNFDINDFVKINESENQNKIQYGDILFTGSSETPDECGMSSVVNKKVEEDIYLNSFCFGFRLNEPSEFDPDFLKHIFRSFELRKQIGLTANGVTRFNVSKKRMEKVKIPIPPLSVQKEIANILDKFNELEKELEKELELRKKQYEYYRGNLLSFNEIGGGKSLIFSKVEWKTLGEIGEFIRGTGLQKKDFTETGVPAIHYGQIYTKYGNSVTETISFVSEELAKKLRKVNKGDVVITNTSENLEDVGKSLVYLGEKQAVTGGHATIIKPNENLLGKYLVYYTQTNMFSDQKRKYAKGTKVIDVSATDMQKIQIPLPPLEEQKRIVNILDKFDTLTNSITEGLPKEIELRRKQYEYYREKLLSFNKD